MHPLPTRQERPAVEILIEQKCRRVLRIAGELQDELNNLIMFTPTGNIRNTVCDANIHVLAALDYLKKVTT